MSPSSGPKLVIVADADPLVRWSLSHYLGRWFDVRTAGTLADAREALRETSPVALVIGDEFSDGTGRQLAHEAAAACPDLRIIQITADADQDDGGGVATLEKPFSLADVAAIIGVGPPPP